MRTLYRPAASGARGCSDAPSMRETPPRLQVRNPPAWPLPCPPKCLPRPVVPENGLSVREASRRCIRGRARQEPSQRRVLRKRDAGSQSRDAPEVNDLPGHEVALIADKKVQDIADVTEFGPALDRLPLNERVEA